MSQRSTEHAAAPPFVVSPPLPVVVSPPLPAFGVIWARLQPAIEKSIAIIVFLLGWEIAPRLGLINRTFLRPFSEVILRGIEYAAGKLLPQILISVERAAGSRLPSFLLVHI
jgi:ABC-type nitrate/sulfonate/bicarbonate transport system permease component